MERSLLWIAFAVGCAGWLCGLLASRTRRDSAQAVTIARPLLVAAIILPFAVYAVTLPSAPPFTAGHGMGGGFLVGGLGALLAAWVATRVLADKPGPALTMGAVVAGAFVGLSANAAVLMWLKPDIIDSLCGLAIGWIAVTITLAAGLHDDGAAETRIDTLPHILTPSPAHVFTASLLFACSLAVAEMLGIYRGASAAESGLWIEAVIALGIAVPLAVLVCVIPARRVGLLALRIPLAGGIAAFTRRIIPSDDARETAGRGYRLLLGSFILIAVGKLIADKIIDDARLTAVVGVGLVSGLLVWWLSSSTNGDAEITKSDERYALYPREALTFLIVAATYMIAFNRLGGFGVCLAAITLWPALAMSLIQRPTATSTGVNQANKPSDVLIRALSILLILGLYRVFYTRFEGAFTRSDLESHYAIFGMLVGAIYPTCLAAFMARPYADAASNGARLMRLVLLAGMLLAIPASMIAFWDSTCTLGLITGLALAPALSRSVSSRIAPVGSALLALAGAFVLTQWYNHAMVLSSLTRPEKVRLIEGIAIGAALILLTADYGTRMAFWSRRGTSASHSQEGGDQ